MKKFCIAPWNHILISRKVKPCCVFEGGIVYPANVSNIFEFYSESYKKLKESNNMLDPGCIQCFNKEKLGFYSRRKKYDDLFGDIYFNDIYFLDIRFSNICNLKCRMCESGASTRWVEDEKYLIENNMRIRNPIAPYKTPSNIVNKLIDHCNNYKNDRMFIEIKGGEPFISKEFLSFLKETNDSFKQKTEIQIYTNGLILKNEYLDELQKFKKLTIYLSVESSINDLYKYIRGGSKYSINDVTNNIKKLQLMNINIKINITILIYNIFYLNDLLEWLHDLGFKKGDYFFSNFVFKPFYLDPGILADEHKQILYDMYKDNDELYNVIKYLKSKNYNKERMNEFKKFTELLDIKRGETECSARYLGFILQ